MGHNEDYTFSSAAKRKPRKLRIKKTYMSDDDDDDAVGTSDAPYVSPAEVNVPSHQIAPRSFKDNPETDRRRLALKSRLKKYQKEGDEAIPAVMTSTPGDSSGNPSPPIITGNGSSVVSSSSGSDEVVPNRAGSFPYTNPQEDPRSRNVHQGKSDSSSLQKHDASLQTTAMEVDENDSDSDDSDSDSDEMEEEELEDDGTVSKGPTQRYEKYRTALGRSSSNELTWEKPKAKLGAPPSFDYDPSQPRQKAPMFGGTSDVQSSAYKLPPGALDGSKPDQSKSRGNARDSPVPESKILGKEDMATLKMMLLGGSSSDEEDDSDGLSFPSKDSSEDIVPPKTAEITAGNQVQAAMSEDVDMADVVCEEVSYHSSEVAMSEQGERAYESEVGHSSSEEVAEMLTSEEEDEPSEIEEDDAPNHRAVVGMAAIAGAAAAKRSSQPDVEEVTESIASGRDGPSTSTYAQSESTVPVSERIGPAKNEREERKSEEIEEDDAPNHRAVVGMAAIAGAVMLTSEEGDEPSEIEEDDAPNHRAVMGMAAIAGTAAAKRSSQPDVEEVTESIASGRDDPSKSTYAQSESTVPVSERIGPAKKESEERKSEASAIAAAVAASGYQSNLVHKEVEEPTPKEEPKVERMVQLKAVPKSLNDDADLGGFLDAEAAKDPLARQRISQYDRDQHSERSDDITNSQGDDDDFSNIWEQSVVEENKGRPQSSRAMGYSDETSFPSRNSGASSLRKNDSDSTENSKNEGKEAEGLSLASSKYTGKDTDASSRTSAKDAGKEADSQANEKNGRKGAAAGYALASTTGPPEDTPQVRTFQQSEPNSSDSSGSMDFDFGNGPLQTGNGPLQTGDDDNSMESFSLGTSKDLESLAISKYDKEEYKPKRSGSEASLSVDEMEAMNTGMQNFEGLSDSDVGKEIETDPVHKPDKTSSKETKSSSATALRKPTFYSSARRNCVRGTVILLVLAAGALPAYFLITGQEARADKDIQSVNLFELLPSASPSQNPVVDTMQPQPTIAPVSPTIQPVAPTPSPTAVAPRPTTQSPSLQPVTPTVRPSQSPSLRPSTLSPTQSPTMNPVDFLVEFLTAASPDLQEALMDTTSQQYTALLWLSTDPDLFSYPNFKLIQRFALATFYLTTGGNTWANNDAWLTDVDECLWYSSSTNIAPCDFMGLFVNLELELNNIGGALPSELSLLSNSLTRIDLTRTGSQDFLSGPIPPEFGQLTKLEYFVLSGNQITGSLPPTLGQWTLLEVADLSNNLLSGPLPEASGMLSQLSILDLDGNQFNGPIPTTIGRLTKIRNLSIANNRLTGPIPSEIGRLFLLEDLNLEQNELTTLPAELGNLIFLRFFSVSKNNIAGLLPPQIGSLVNILTLDLSENALSGTIPTEMGNLFLIRGMLSICVASSQCFINRVSQPTQCLCFEQIL
jgi:hypothetical protein